MRLRTLLAVAFCWLAGQAAAQAENRMALVIGNSSYQAVTKLPNPANDAKAVSEMLTSAGFEVVSASDLTQADMRKAIGDFSSRVAAKGSDTVALVFYAGHGVQVDGENYLIPVDARIQREADVPLQALRLADLMNALAAVPSRMRIVMLDACRNNPFSEINKTSGRGLAIVDAPPGSLVSYATAPGSEAEDGEGANSPYTRALLTVAREPGLPIEQALKRMRFAVHDATARRQTPWESSSLTGDFSFFAGPGASAKAAEQKPTLVSASASQTRVASRSVESWTKELRARPAAEAYELVIKEDTPEAYQAFISLHSGQPFGSATRTLLERRREMIAWYTAVTVNTVVSLQEFLALYPNSDLAISARGLMTRAANRSYVSIPAPCECSQPVPPPTQRRATTRSNRAAVQPQTPAPRVQQQPPQRVIIIDNNPPPRIQPFPIRPIGPIYPPGRPPIISDPVRPPSGRPPVITDPVRPPSGKPPVIAEPGRPPSIGVRPIGPIGPMQRHPTGGGPVIR